MPPAGNNRQGLSLEICGSRHTLNIYHCHTDNTRENSSQKPLLLKGWLAQNISYIASYLQYGTYKCTIHMYHEDLNIFRIYLKVSACFFRLRAPFVHVAMHALPPI